MRNPIRWLAVSVRDNALAWIVGAAASSAAAGLAIIKGYDPMEIILFASAAAAFGAVGGHFGMKMVREWKHEQEKRIAIEFNPEVHIQPIGEHSKAIRVSVANKKTAVVNGASLRIDHISPLDAAISAGERMSQFRSAHVQPEHSPNDGMTGIKLSPGESETYIIANVVMEDAAVYSPLYNVSSGAPETFWFDLVSFRVKITATAQNSAPYSATIEVPIDDGIIGTVRFLKDG